MPQRIEAAQQHLAERLLSLPGVTAVGIGEVDGAPCLRVWVVAAGEDLTKAIPDEYAGFAVIVEESGPLEARDEPA